MESPPEVTEIQIKTGDFEYINQKFYGLTAAEAVEKYDELKLKHALSDGLPVKEWNAIVDKYLTGGKILNGDFERMNGAQRWFIHEIDKSFNRINKE